MKMKPTNTRLRITTLLATACTVLSVGNVAEATEGGSGLYALGYISPQAGLMPEAGTYASYNFYSYRGKSTTNVAASGQIPVPGTHLKLPAQLDGSLKTQADSPASLFSLTHIFQGKILGGQPGVAVLLPYVSEKIDVDASGVLSLEGLRGHVHNFPRSGKDSARDSGIGDTTLTGMLGWHDGRLHTMAMLNVYAPTGSFDKQRLANVGRNHWAIEPMVALTYLNESSGLEISSAGGITFNQKNQATEYKSGNEFHLDLAAIQHFSDRFYAGLAAYYYQQLTADSGSGATSAYKGRVYAAGPIIGGVIPLGQQQQLYINARYYQEHGAENRLSGNTFFLTATVKY